MQKVLALSLLGVSLITGGCAAFLDAQPLYKEPVGEGDNIARIRFVGNVTSTSIKTKEDGINRDLVLHNKLGFYNETHDIGMPKLSYRQQDYKSYYFEIRVKPQPMVLTLTSDNTNKGFCTISVLFSPEKGKDYDINFDTHEQFTQCKLHLNQIVTDPSTGVPILKPAPFKRVPMLYAHFE